MRKILGLMLCVGFCLAGLAASHGAPLPDVGVQYEVTADVGSAVTLERFETLTRISRLAAEQTSAEYAERIAALTGVPDFASVTATPFDPAVGELQPDATCRKPVIRLIDTDYHRWRRRHAESILADNIYRPVWNRRVCEG